jgi:hypothetical protein
MKPVIFKNLTPLPYPLPYPSLQGKGDFKASPRVGERFTRGVYLYIKNF